jgi:hypothetical protein
MPRDVSALWDPRLQTVPDNNHDGRPTPGLVCRLMTPDMHDNFICYEGDLMIKMFAEQPGHPESSELIEWWALDKETLKKTATKDMIGWGYTLFLPSDKCRPPLKHVRMSITFIPAGTTTPIAKSSTFQPSFQGMFPVQRAGYAPPPMQSTYSNTSNVLPVVNNPANGPVGNGPSAQVPVSNGPPQMGTPLMQQVQMQGLPQAGAPQMQVAAMPQGQQYGNAMMQQQMPMQGPPAGAPQMPVGAMPHQQQYGSPMMQPMQQAQPQVGTQSILGQPQIVAQPVQQAQPQVGAQTMQGQPQIGAQPMQPGQPQVGAQPIQFGSTPTQQQLGSGMPQQGMLSQMSPQAIDAFLAQLQAKQQQQMQNQQAAAAAAGASSTPTAFNQPTGPMLPVPGQAPQQLQGGFNQPLPTQYQQSVPPTYGPVAPPVRSGQPAGSQQVPVSQLTMPGSQQVPAPQQSMQFGSQPVQAPAPPQPIQTVPMPYRGGLQALPGQTGVLQQ